MDNFQIETAQNITIQQNVAHVSTRIGSHLIDVLILLGYYFGIMVFFNLIDYTPDFNNITPYLILILPYLFYSLLFEVFMNGQTPGKYFNKIRVVKLDGSKPTFGSYLIRWFLRFIDINIFSGGVAILTIMLNGKGQRLGDIAAGTTVISEKKRVKITDTILESVVETHTPTFPQVTVLTDEEVQTIHKIFKNAKRKRKHNVILKLSFKVKEMTNIQSDLQPMELVDTVIKDYYHYTQE